MASVWYKKYSLFNNVGYLNLLSLPLRMNILFGWFKIDTIGRFEVWTPVTSIVNWNYHQLKNAHDIWVVLILMMVLCKYVLIYGELWCNNVAILMNFTKIKIKKTFLSPNTYKYKRRKRIKCKALSTLDFHCYRITCWSTTLWCQINNYRPE